MHKPIDLIDYLTDTTVASVLFPTLPRIHDTVELGGGEMYEILNVIHIVPSPSVVATNIKLIVKKL